jgi:hypothetical protein
MFKALEPFGKEVMVDEPSKDIILHVYVACNLSKVIFLKQFSRVEVLI